MLKSRMALLCCGIFLAGLMATGCSDDDPVNPGANTADPVPDFTLVDVNTTSATADQGVSPRDYLQKVSAWYFGRAT